MPFRPDVHIFYGVSEVNAYFHQIFRTNSFDYIDSVIMYFP